MIDALANRIADYVAENDETADHEIIAYGASLLIMAVVTYTTFIASALLFGVLREMLIAIGVFILMRATVGGLHANHRATCLITYSGILYFSIFFAGILNMSWHKILVMYIINIALLILYAPGDTAEQPMVKFRLTRKLLGLVFLSCIFAAPMFFSGIHTDINILLFISTWTCVSLHPFIYKVFGCKRS